MRSERCEPLGFFIDEPVSVRLSFILSRSLRFNSVYQFSGRDDSGASGSVGQQ